MIERRPEAVSGREFDLAIVGGGIYGATLALESARRGLRPVLVERADFGGATSWNSLRIVHGGLRYLQTLDLRRFHQSVDERAWWMQCFPELVRPLACLMPLYGRGLRRPAIFRAALALNDLLGRPSSSRLPDAHRLPPGRILSAEQTIERFPAVEREGLVGGALWYDASMPDSPRLIVEVLRWAATAGAEVLNYTEARRLIVESGRVVGLAAHDLESDLDVGVTTPLVVNAAGPWCRRVAACFDRDHPSLFEPSVAFNLLLDLEPLSECALAVSPPSAPTYFLHPWKGRTLAGTVHSPVSDPPHRVSPPSQHAITSFLEQLNRAIPEIGLGPAHVLRVHWGLLPAREEGTATLATRPVILDHARSLGPRGLWSVSGVKFTTARAVAEATLHRIFAAGGGSLPNADTAAPPAATSWPSRERIEALLESDQAAARTLIERMMVEEAAPHLDDVLLRRTDWAADPADAERLADRLARALGWDENRMQREVARTGAHDPATAFEPKEGPA
ncbi:MAG TPA: FAD-dependent oxidoreductase [Thermoanaerobaculia bacterium]|nr:FAD-dependent oxidoreductase [Thermoanaerobaculia bacterium]